MGISTLFTNKLSRYYCRDIIVYMVLATHAVVGTIVATTFTSNPVFAFFIAFASHFILDPIPHWDYKLFSFKKDEKEGINHDMVLGKHFIIDLLRIAIDGILGAIISFILFLFILKQSSFLVILASIIGATLPDPLQFLYWKTRSKLLLPLQKFHVRIHAKSLPLHPKFGVPLQVLVVLVFLSISTLIQTN